MNFDELIEKLRNENAIDWKTKAIDELSEKIYESDKLNLVCELIQNANDSYANKVCFVVKSDEINLYHDGNPFNEIDITKISRCGESKKKNKPTEKIIGRFGVGFKSVFKYCNEPQIYSTFHGENVGFKLKEIFSPYKIPPSNHNKRKLGKTRFCLRIRKIKPFSEIYESEIVFYAFTNDLPFQSEPCPHMSEGIRTEIREFLNSLETQHSGIKNNLYQSVLKVSQIVKDTNYKQKMSCKKCGNPCTGDVCSVCSMILKLKENQT